MSPDDLSARVSAISAAPWAAACATCGWTATAATYTTAGEACRAHDCPDPNTTVTPTDGDRDDVARLAVAR